MCTRDHAIPRPYERVIREIHGALDAGDDPAYWTALLTTVLEEIDARWTVQAPEARAVVLGVSRVSHWRRPHQWRWTGGGGFAWPASYSQHAEHHADWSLWFARSKRQEAWSPTSGANTNKRGHYRATIVAPSGTSEHPQAAAMMVWRPRCPFETEHGRGTVRQMYGLRRDEVGWGVVAYQEYGERGGT